MGEECCKRCCYSTPYATIFGLSMTIVGLVGFSASSISGVVMIHETSSLEDHLLLFAPVVAGMVVLTILPLTLTTIMAYCVTGYIRDELYGSFVKRYIGSFCSFFGMTIMFIFVVLWMLMLVVLGSLLTLFVQLSLGCSDLQSTNPSPFSNSTCFPSNSSDFTVISPICGGELEELCDNGQDVGLSFVISLGFSILVLLGLVVMLVIQGANYVNARENMEYRKSYQPRTNGEEYSMKRVR